MRPTQKPAPENKSFYVNDKYEKENKYEKDNKYFDRTYTANSNVGRRK
jgi:hypothetical protein